MLLISPRPTSCEELLPGTDASGRHPQDLHQETLSCSGGAESSTHPPCALLQGSICVGVLSCSSCCCFCQDPHPVHPECLLPHQGTLGSWRGASSPGLAGVSIPAEWPWTPRGARGRFSCRQGRALPGYEGSQCISGVKSDSTPFEQPLQHGGGGSSGSIQ